MMSDFSGQEVEEERAVLLRREHRQFAPVLLGDRLVDLLHVRRLAAEGGPVVDDLERYPPCAKNL